MGMDRDFVKMSAAGLEDVEGVDADFFAKFEEEFKEHQDSERKKKRTKPFRSRKGSQTPPATTSFEMQQQNKDQQHVQEVVLRQNSLV